MTAPSRRLTDSAAPPARPDAGSALDNLTRIRAEMVSHPLRAEHRLSQVHPSHRASAGNLLHYLTLRKRDLRPLQMQLAELGLSSLGRAEPHVLAAVDAVLDALHHITGRTTHEPTPAAEVGFGRGPELLAGNRDSLLGPPSPGRAVRIMVTMPDAAAHDSILVRDLLQQGMNCMRINCAHGDSAEWLQMIANLRKAEEELARTCRVVMDLGGPKLRTGPIQAGPPVLRIRPERDAFGRVMTAGRVWLTDLEAGHPGEGPASMLTVGTAWLAGLCAGDRIRFTDTRDAERTLTVVECRGAGCLAEVSHTAYVTNGTVLRHERDGLTAQTTVSNISRLAGSITLRRGDTLVLTRDLTPGTPATQDQAGRVLTPATIGCSIPEVFSDVRAGEAIWFDDGAIGGVVERVESDCALVRITHARPGGSALRAGKGINLPDSLLRLPALTAKDLTDLAFVARHADIVELSFANHAGDVDELQDLLAALGRPDMAIVLKIETRRGFENLPEMLLSAMRSPRCGVMIARGDLAVECGFERLAEVQEEILWICEAAHVPVIWATQVLETLAKEGIPSRSEVTDAAMGHRAECVMLNKGPHVLSAIRVLDDILRRMQAHQTKKRAMLRELRLAHAFPEAVNDIEG